MVGRFLSTIDYYLVVQMGVYLSDPKTQKDIHEGSLGKIKFVSAEMQGWRKNMEDAAIFDLDIGDGNSLFAVFDGHGGAEVSCYVKEIFLNVLKETSWYKKKEYVNALNETFKKVDEMIESEAGNEKLKAIRARLEQQGGPNNQSISAGTGCTANVVLITPQKYYVANAGDSRSALCSNGKLVVMSEDHKPESQQQIARIQHAGGQVVMGRVNGGLNLTRSFGDFDYKRNPNLSYSEQIITCKPDIKQISRSQEDEFIIMGCDGIWQKYVENSQGMISLIKQKLDKKQDYKKIITDLLDFLIAKDTREGVGCDNMTAILLTLK